ncbi:hypothetical protein FN846DRAFT_960317 [Sphaerosporella brunnea]|uniref:Nucleoporin Nup159/Nup146 N-terminal domain-containing protein n=1 Tax=Sphaerosporella brunnea TaxID=1250544 RepID=A0A5J5EQ85_9PEZI|nr:hypothetical protein FN846DRAFT_960317 [Sphaerosporella brunnea]
MSGNPFGVLGNSQLAGDQDPEDVEIPNFGFLSLGHDRKIKVLPEGFTKDSLPRPWASLFAVANRRGLFAAAGPKSFVISQTQTLREAFTAKDENYTPQLCIPSAMPISHVAFNADESRLILGGSNGVVAVWSLDALGGSDPKATIEVFTDGQELREVKPNPKIPELVAIVTTNGDVRMLDLNTNNYKTGADGSPVLKKSVSTVSWSKLGKQIMCGMSNGSLWQMTPAGEGKAELPAPPNLENHFVSSLLWLENHLFVTTHTPVPVPDGEIKADSVFHTLERHDTQFTYKKLFDPTPPWGMDDRSPPYFFTAQIQAYGPALRNAIIFSSTCSTDVGVVVRFSNQGNDVPADTFVTAVFPEDTRRAGLPLAADSTDTSPIGMALDLSAKDNVTRPVGGEEIDESPGPLPIVMVLNFEGVVVAWNVIYNDAIEKGQKYESMVIYDKEQAQEQQQPIQSSTSVQSTASLFAGSSPFGQSSIGASTSASPFAAAASSAASGFGKPSFGQPSTAAPASSGGSLFAQPSPGSTSSPWGSASQPPSTPKSTPSATFGQPSQLGTAGPAPAFGKPGFGQASQLGASQAPAFGAPSQFGANPAFGQPSTLGASPAASGFGKPAFGQPGFGSVASSPAPAAGSTFGSGSGFATFANKGGFAAAVSAQPSPGGSIFGSGKPISTGAGSDSVFNTPTKGNGAATFGTGSIQGFKLSSGFKPEPSQAEDNAKADDSGSLGGFGSSLGGALGGSAPLFGKPAFGGADGASSPFATSSPFAAAANKAASPFDAPPSSAGGVANPFAQANPFGAPFAKASATPKPEEAPLPPDFTGERIKELSSSDEEVDNENIPEAPLPPDITSRPSYAAGSTTTEGTPNLPSSPESSLPASPSPEAAPLPPDFTTPKKQAVQELPPALPEEDESEGADDERDEGAEGEEEDDEEEEEYDEEEGEEEEESDNEKENETPQKPTGLFGSTPAAKKPTTPGSGSSIFDQAVPRAINKNAPFSSFFEKKEEIASDEGDEDEDKEDKEDEEETHPQPQRKTPTVKGMTKGGKPSLFGGKGSGLVVKRDERLMRLIDSKKEEKFTGGLPSAKKPLERLEAPKEPPKLEAPKPPAGFLGGEKATSGHFAAASPFSPGLSKPASPLNALPTPTSTPAKDEELEAEVESVVDYDAEYSDSEDVKIREQLLNGPLKPCETLPEIKKLTQVEVPDEFADVFDSIYASGNMMVNKLGQMARGLKSYHSAQNQPVEGAKHETPEDMKPADNWHLSEMGVISKSIDELLRDVQKINSEKPKLEEKRQIASKGFIKLNTMDAEIKRLLAVHNDPITAAQSRARLLPPEQQLQQRQLRKSFTRVEKSLKDAEYKATMLKAKLASRDRNRSKRKLQPPTAEAVRTTVMKLTAMAERKSRDVGMLEERMRRLRVGNKSRSMISTPGRFGTPEPATPHRSISYGVGMNSSIISYTPVMALVEEGDLEDAVEDRRRRREAGKKLKGALQKMREKPVAPSV